MLLALLYHQLFHCVKALLCTSWESTTLMHTLMLWLCTNPPRLPWSIQSFTNSFNLERRTKMLWALSGVSPPEEFDSRLESEINSNNCYILMQLFDKYTVWQRSRGLFHYCIQSLMILALLVDCYPMSKQGELASRSRYQSQVPNMRRMIGEDGEDVISDNVQGEILLRSPAIMSGYLNNSQTTNLTIVDGWLHTGDIAYVEEGRWFLIDRKKVCLLILYGSSSDSWYIGNHQSQGLASFTDRNRTMSPHSPFNRGCSSHWCRLWGSARRTTTRICRCRPRSWSYRPRHPRLPQGQTRILQVVVWWYSSIKTITSWFHR